MNEVSDRFANHWNILNADIGDWSIFIPFEKVGYIDLGDEGSVEFDLIGLLRQ